MNRTTATTYVFENYDEEKVHYEVLIDITDDEAGNSQSAFDAGIYYTVKCRIDEDDDVREFSLGVQFVEDDYDNVNKFCFLSECCDNGVFKGSDYYSEELVDALIEHAYDYFKDSLAVLDSYSKDRLRMFFKIFEIVEEGVEKNKSSDDIDDDIREYFGEMYPYRGYDYVRDNSGGFTFRDILHTAEHYDKAILRQEEDFESDLSDDEIDELQKALETYKKHC